MVPFILGSGIKINAQGGESTPSVTRTGMKANGTLTPCMDRAGSHSRMDHSMSAAGKQGSQQKKGNGALLMGRQSTKGSSAASCCGMALVRCTRLASESIWVRPNSHAAVLAACWHQALVMSAVQRPHNRFEIQPKQLGMPPPGELLPAKSANQSDSNGRAQACATCYQQMLISISGSHIRTHIARKQR